MKTKRFLFILIILPFITGCIVPSIYPLYTDKDIEFDQKLLGTWTDEDEKSTWRFERGSEDFYELTYTEDEMVSMFDVCLVRLEDETFLDFYPQESAELNEFYSLHLIPAHSFARVLIKGSRIEIEFLSLEWLQEAIEDRKIRIDSMEFGDERIVLTAPTKELQRMILSIQDNEDAFSDPLKLFPK